MHKVEKCLLCESKKIENIPDGRDVGHWECPNCKEVLVSGTAMVTMEKHKSEFWLLSAFYRRQSKLKLPAEMLHSSNFNELINMVSEPKNINEAKSRIIEYLGDNSDLLGSYMEYDETLHLDIVIQKSELNYLLYDLHEQGIVDTYYEPARVGDEYIFERLRLSSEGWELYDDIKRTPVESNKVFIAMWFNEETKQIRESLKSAVIAAGYDPIIVDEEHFTGNIMEYVIGQIGQSKFLIADFTVAPEIQPEIDEETLDETEYTQVKNGTRGGVYYEAGFAKGIGLEVIHTCRNNKISKNRLHFDIAQDNTLFWLEEELKDREVRDNSTRSKNPSPQNFTEKVFDRIIYIFGHGEN